MKRSRVNRGLFAAVPSTKNSQSPTTEPAGGARLVTELTAGTRAPAAELRSRATRGQPLPVVMLGFYDFAVSLRRGATKSGKAWLCRLIASGYALLATVCTFTTVVREASCVLLVAGRRR